MTQSRSKRFSLRRTSLEHLEPRQLLAGLSDDIVLPDGPAGDFIREHQGLLSSPSLLTLDGARFGDTGRFPKALRSASDITKATPSTAGTRIFEAESLDPSLLDINDIIDEAQPIPLGFGPGEVDSIDVRGSIEEPLLPGTVNSTEDDGSIPLANETNIIPGTAVNAVGTIGDGPQVVTGDFDFFRVPDVVAGDLITAQVDGQAGLDPAVAIYNSVGELMISNDDSGNTTNSYVSYIAPDDDDYYVLVLGSGLFGFTLPANPFDPASGGGFFDTTGPYEATIGLNYGDIDYYSMTLEPGDVLGVDVLGSANDVTLFNSQGSELVGNRDGAAGLLYSSQSPLPNDGVATIPYVINEPGTYFARVLGDFTGNYESRFRLFRPVLEQEEPGTRQILFIDFDGETIDTNIFLDEFGEIVTLSPLRDFLPNWGLSGQDESRVISEILAVVQEQLRNDVGRFGLNGDYRTTRDPGDFGIEIRNSRDHADPYGLPNVSRVIVGGDIDELGIPTVGIAQSVDPGNFNTEETAVVLLDILSDPVDPISVNSFLANRPQADIYDLIGAAVGGVVTHEAGHFFGNYHTEIFNENNNIMDTGGDARSLFGVGEDGILGTQDDDLPRFGVDSYAPDENFTGWQDTLNTIAFGLPSGRGARSTSATGVKWNDLNSNGIRDAGEPGISGFIIYVDVNNDNEFGIGEPATVTGADGRYTLRNVPAGTFAVREVIDPGWVQTFPAGDGGQFVTFSVGREASGVDFGNRRGSGVDMGVDFGDAPSPYPTLLGDDGPRHGIVPGFQLGGQIDGEANGQPTRTSNGDDINGVDDEDGVVFLTDVIPGLESTVSVTVSNGAQPPGVLQAWIDFDGDGDWTSAGEQIFADLSVSEGVNVLTFDVPAWAVQGSSVARFRYGYERGISYTGSAVAGEVEDHSIDVVRGGPVANDDAYTIRRNSGDNFLDVTDNDSFRPQSGTVISNVSTPGNGTAMISNDNLGIIYTPNFDFDGTDSFSYTLRDANGETDSANVSVVIQPDLALIRLDTSDTDGNPISRIGVGQQFVLQGIVQDLRDIATGVFSAYADVDYTTSSVTVEGPILFGADYPNGQSGDTSVDGLIDEVGGFDGIVRLGPGETLLFSVVMRATQEGTIGFTPSPADIVPQHNVLLFDNDMAVPVEQIEYRSTGLIVDANGVTVQTNPLNALDVNDDRFVSPVDALLVINELNSDGTVQGAQAANGISYFLDVNGDGFVSPIDALLVINRLNQSAEGESPAVSLAAVAAAVQSDSLSGKATSEDRVESDDSQASELDGIYAETSQTGRAQLFASLDDFYEANDREEDHDLDVTLDLITDDLVGQHI